MTGKELRNLQESYMEIYNPERIDEDSRRMSNKQHAERVRGNIKAFSGSKTQYTPPRNWDPEANRGKGAILRPKQVEKKRRKELVKSASNESYDIYDVILSHLLDEGYAETVESAEAIMVNMSEEWIDSIVDEVITEGEKPFPYEKVTAQQKKHTAAGRYGNMMKMGLAKRRAKEADKRGGSQQDAGKGWYHGR